MLSPTQQAAQQLKQQLGGKAVASAPAPQPGFFSRNIINPVKNAISSGVNQIKQGFSQASQVKGPVQGFEAAGKIGSGIATTLSSPLAPIFNPVNKATNALADKISNNPTVQNFANSKAGQVTSRVAEDVGNFANIAGTTAGGMEAYKLATDHPIFQRSTPIMDPATVTGAQEQVNVANQNYAQADVGAAQATSTANQAVRGDVGKGGALGNEFGAGIKNITEANPTGTSALSQSQLEALNNLKEGKNFQLPNKFNTETSPVVQMSPDVAAKNAGKIADIKNANAVNVTPSEAADLMRELNGSTYKIADGQKVIDQSRIGITKELEQHFAKDFGNLQGANGETWQNVYQNFKQGVQFRDTLDGIVNFDKTATPLDLIKQTDNLQKALQTPGGEYQIQKVIDEYAKVRGEDKASVLEDLIAKTKEVGRTQDILKTAQTNLKEAVAMAEKGGYGKQFITELKKPSLAARRLIGPVVGIPATIILLPYLRKLYKSMTGQ